MGNRRASGNKWTSGQVLVVITVLGALGIEAPRVVAAATGNAGALVDLTTDVGTTLMQANWRYSDARIVETLFPAPDPDGQPTGTPTLTHDIEPHAGQAEFDDSGWARIAPATLSQRRGAGRVSFNWYRINLTVPADIDGFDPTGSTVSLATRLDDYAEIWVDGELSRA